MENITRTLGMLAGMIAANNKRTNLYLSFAEKTSNPELKSLFTRNADQSRRFASHLSTWRSAYGGFAPSEKETGVNRPSLIRALLAFGLRKDTLTQCEELEQDTINIYKSAISKAVMPAATVNDVQKQVRDFEKALAELSHLREQPRPREKYLQDTDIPADRMAARQ